jgi:hypothetical protein
MRLQRFFFWLPALPIAAAMVATVLFLSQGGFGAGHGKFDMALGILASPGILLVDYVPLPTTVPDFVLVVILPAMLNVVLWLALTRILRAVLRCKSTA